MSVSGIIAEMDVLRTKMLVSEMFLSHVLTINSTRNLTFEDFNALRITVLRKWLHRELNS